MPWSTLKQSFHHQACQEQQIKDFLETNQEMCGFSELHLGRAGGLKLKVDGKGPNMRFVASPMDP